MSDNFPVAQLTKTNAEKSGFGSSEQSNLLHLILTCQIKIALLKQKCFFLNLTKMRLILFCILEKSEACIFKKMYKKTSCTLLNFVGVRKQYCIIAVDVFHNLMLHVLLFNLSLRYSHSSHNP